MITPMFLWSDIRLTLKSALMAQHISMTHGETGIRQAVPIGFSWTTLFFGFFVPLIRGDIKWAAIMFVVAIMSLAAGFLLIGVIDAIGAMSEVFRLLSLAGPLAINIVFAMRYNTLSAAALVEAGFDPTEGSGRRLLAARGIGARDPAPADVGPDGSGRRQRSDPVSGEHEGHTDPAASASDPASSSKANRIGGGMRDRTRNVVAIAGGVLCVVAAFLPFAHMPIIGAVSWLFIDGEFATGVFVAAAGVVATLLGLLGCARGWNLIPSLLILAVAILGIVGFTEMLEKVQSKSAAADLGIFEGLAEMAMSSVSLGAAAPMAIVGAIVVLASAVAPRCGTAAASTGHTPADLQSRNRIIVGAVAASLLAIWAVVEFVTGPDQGVEPSSEMSIPTNTETRFEDATLVVSLGDTVPGFLTAEDEHYFEFRILRDGFRLAAYTLGSTDTHGTLYDRNGSSIASDDDSGESLNFEITRSLDAGTYYLVVTGFLWAEGSYSLVVAGQTPDGAEERPRETADSWCTDEQAEFLGFQLGNGKTISICEDEGLLTYFFGYLDAEPELRYSGRILVTLGGRAVRATELPYENLADLAGQTDDAEEQELLEQLACAATTNGFIHVSGLTASYVSILYVFRSDGWQYEVGGEWGRTFNAVEGTAEYDELANHAEYSLTTRSPVEQAHCAVGQ